MAVSINPRQPQVIASASIDGSVMVWDTSAKADSTAPPITLLGHQNDVNIVEWISNWYTLVSGGDDAAVHVHDTRSQSCLNHASVMSQSCLRTFVRPTATSAPATGAQCSSIGGHAHATDRGVVVTEVVQGLAVLSA